MITLRFWHGGVFKKHPKLGFMEYVAWPRIDMQINPPSIKIGPGRPRKNRRKKPHEDPKRPGKLTKQGVIMTCSICKSTSHNKRRCPDKDNVTQSNPKKQNPTTTLEAAPTHIVNASYDHFIGATQESINFTYEAGVNFEMCANGGKGRGRGGIKRGRGGKENFLRNGNIMEGQQSQATSAQPSKTGKGNKVIKSGLGSRGGKTKAMSRSGKLTCGFGVIIGDDGSPIINEPRRQAANILNNGGINAQVLSSATQASINVSLR